MRTIKELLILLREKLPSVIPMFALGLCASTRILRGSEQITLDEYFALRAYLYTKSPDHTADTGYWWPHGELAPRLEFLDKLIAEL